MATPCVLWFDARCPVSRRALDLLRERGVEPELRRFLEEPPSAAELAELLAKLGAAPHDVARPSEDEYQVLRLSERTPRDALLEALATHPRILDGPFFVCGERAVAARPAERVLEVLPPAGS